MLLRSSSTPVLGSLLSSFSESPNNIPNHFEAKPNAIINHTHNKLSFHQTGHHLSFTTLSSNSSPISPSIDLDSLSHRAFRRAQSEGNLAGLACDTSFARSDDQFSASQMPSKFTRRPKCLILETIHSFSYHDSKGVSDEEDESEVEEFEEREDYYGETRSSLTSMSLAQEVRIEDSICGFGRGWRNEMAGRGLFVEKGLEVGGGGGGGGSPRDFGSSGGGGDEGDKAGVEEYYRRMVEENPGNALFLGNYAQFLYQSKGDLKRAEEYYSRAILADPKEGGNLSRYAELVWELHRDQDRAMSYYERAVQASPQDSHIQAAYANFLWETEDNEEIALQGEGSMVSATA